MLRTASLARLQALATIARSKQKNTARVFFCLERATGIEPARSAWEAEVLPLNYARIFYKYFTTYCATSQDYFVVCHKYFYKIFSFIQIYT